MADCGARRSRPHHLDQRNARPDSRLPPRQRWAAAESPQPLTCLRFSPAPAPSPFSFPRTPRLAGRVQPARDGPAGALAGKGLAAARVHGGHRRPRRQRQDGADAAALPGAAREALAGRRDLCGNQPVRRVHNSSLSHFSTMTRPSWLGRAARNRHRHAMEQTSRRWRERAVKF